MRKLLYVCEDYVPPATNGSSLVYLSCLEALSREYEVFAIMFGDPDCVEQETRDVLGRLCKAYIIVSGVQRSAILKLARTLSRALTGQLIAPRFLEEMDRSETYQQIKQFIKTNGPDIIYVHKYHCVPRLGQDIIASFSGTRLVDLHDDFVAREEAERKVLKYLFKEYPLLKKYRPYARIRLKQRLSRFSAATSRRQELAVLGMFDWILGASESEVKVYSQFLPGRVAYCPWPVSSSIRSVDRCGPKYAAGFIGSDAIFNLEGLMAFAMQELPFIRDSNPEFTFVVGGGICDAFRLACPNHDALGIAVMGRLKNVTDFYRSVGRVVVPLLNGSGVSLKTLEAASYGVPVISTPVGVRGIPTEVLPSHVQTLALAKFNQALRLPIIPVVFARPQQDKAARYLSDLARIISGKAGCQ
jgi:glycosyltransferase involved in cell wall biosynthesis